jgi:hypothetical protein
MITAPLEMSDEPAFEHSVGTWESELTSDERTEPTSVSYDSSDRTFLPGLVDEIIFQLGLGAYFDARGTEQKKLREDLWSELRQAKEIEEKLAMVLAMVESRKSQDTIAAAIDLLTPFADHLGPLAVQLAFEDLIDENVAFVLTSALCRQLQGFARFLVASRHTAVREAVIEALADASAPEAQPLLLAIARSDPSPSLRERAKQVLDEWL